MAKKGTVYQEPHKGTTVYWERFEPTDKRLGRHIVHDSRSLRYLAPARDPKTLGSVRHTINIPFMNQGSEGSCTGHGGVNNLASGDFWRAFQPTLGQLNPHDYARVLYGDATKLDPWPGEFDPATGVEDTGSDGLSIAKVLLARGLISGYQHATSLAAALTALSERVVMVGTSWHEAMFYPEADGRIRITGDIAGGHEYALDELDVQNERAWIHNSWGTKWGLGGRAYLTFDDLGALLADYGDCTILVPKSEPAPVPTPPPPKPARPAEDKDLAEATKRFMHTSGGPHYLRQALGNWLAVFPKE